MLLVTRNFILACVFFVVSICGIIIAVGLSNQNKAKLIDEERQLESKLIILERTQVLILSNTEIIGGGNVVSISIKGKDRPLLFTARHVLAVAKSYARNNGYYRMAFKAMTDDNIWVIINIPYNVLQWFDAGPNIDLAAIDLYGGLQFLSDRGVSLNSMDLTTEICLTESDETDNLDVTAICPNVYLSREYLSSMNGMIDNPILRLWGNVVSSHARRMIGDAEHDVIVIDFENFVKPGYSGSPVFGILLDRKANTRRLRYLGNIIMAVDNGVNCGVKRIDALIDAIYKQQNRYD